MLQLGTTRLDVAEMKTSTTTCGEAAMLQKAAATMGVSPPMVSTRDISHDNIHEIST